MKRRTFLMGAGGSTAAWAADRRRPWRVALIGHTGRGNYGHDWDIAWNRISAVRVTAIADPVEAGRKVAQERSGAAKAYDDFRDMIASERPEIVTIGPRWTDQRVEMVAAAARAGAHVLLEKPFAGSLPDADAMVKALNAGKVKLQLGHVARPSPVVKQARQMLDAGEIGDLL